MKRGGLSALAVAFACAGVFVASHYAAAQTEATQDGAVTLRLAAAETTEKSGKKASHKSRDRKSKEAKSGERRSKSHKRAKDATSDRHDAGKKEQTAEPLEQSSPQENSDPDVALVRKAIESVRRGGAAKTTEIEASISDPAAHKLVEWIILRSYNSGAGSSRYLSFIAANPSWPSLPTFRRYAEEMLWHEDAKPAQVLRLFKDAPPQSAKGRLALARALMAQGDTEAASAQVREAWRNDAMSVDVESHVLKKYSEFLTHADHKARMEKRSFVADHEAAMRAAHRLGAGDLAIARALMALNGKGGNAAKLLEAVPAEAHQDPGYIFARTHVLRHHDKIAEAAQAMLSAPHDAAHVYDPEEWWVERRVLSRKLLDAGDARSAYLVVRDAAEPKKENSRVERHFMAGWIALRFLNDPGTAAAHFARIPEVSSHPTSLARSHYWLGRTMEALHRSSEARSHYQAAARCSASYYGQLARARIGMGTLALAPPPAVPPSSENMELVRAAEILYALNDTSLLITFMTDVGEKVDDVGVLSKLGELAERHHDARGMLQLGKAALARGLPLDYYAFPAVGVPAYSPIGPGIDRALLFAIIRQESAFNPADLSAAQAMGLMQVTPSAGRDTCKRFGCKYDVRRLKNDSPYNLQVGAAELGGVIQEYGGSYVLAFAAYNAGRGRVQEWIESHGDPRDPKVDPVDWVERIPFMETRNYVQRVMENVQVYRTRFGAHAPLTILTDLRGSAAASRLAGSQ